MINLADYLYLGKGEEATGGRERPAIIADALEAVLGAVYLDGGFEAAREIVKKFFEPYFDDVLKNKMLEYVDELQEYLLKQNELVVDF